VHDNHGTKDEHLWPGGGTIDWKSTATALKALAAPPTRVLEISYSLSEAQSALPGQIEKAFALFE
jgi:sugar phosphate isomerase/epimerase